MSDYKLLPCPFCGGKAQLREDTHELPFSEERTGYFVICVQCGCSPFHSKYVVNAKYKRNWKDLARSMKEEATEKWNTRAQLSRQKRE